MILRRLTIIITFLTAWVWSYGQQINAVPDYVFRNQMSVGRNAVTDTAAYFSIGPRYGANKGFMPPIVGDTATFSSGKRNGLLIFSVQKNKFLYWDSVRVQWSDMAGSSGTYITGSGITGYVPQFSGTTTIDTSGLFTLGSRLGIGTSSFAYTSATSSIELNGTSGGILGFKRNDSARGYLWHTGDNMELANTTAGAISFNTNSATRGSISSAGVWRLHNLAGTGDRVVVASSNGTLSASTSVTGLVDTTTISTRAWRQKGDDSLGAIIATKGSGTVTSVATGFGLSGGTITTTGTLLVDTLNIATRAWRQKGLDSLAALEVSGSGTTNYVAKFTGTKALGNSVVYDDGTNVGIGTTTPTGFQSKILNIFGSTGSEVHLTTTGSGTANSDGMILEYRDSDNSGSVLVREAGALRFGTSDNTRQIIFSNGNIGIGTTTDAGYKTDIAGTLRSTLGANFATTSGNVGVGTASPSVKLDVSQASTGSVVRFQGDASLLRYLEFKSIDAGAFTGAGWDRNVNSASGFHTWSTAGTERLRIFANGRIGVNTTTDAGYQLDVNGTFRAKGTEYVGMFEGTDPAISLKSATYEYYAQLLATSNRFRIVDKTANVERISLTSAGDVGIGQASPSYKLDINGTLRSVNGANFATTSGNVGIGTASPTEKLEVRNVNRDPTSAEFTMNVFATSAQAANFGGSIGLFGATDNAATVFASFAAIQGVKSNSTAGNTGGELRLFTRTAGGPMSERMRIDASGNVGIGTASPAVKLDVTASGGDIAAFRRTDAGNALVQYTNANTTDDIIHRFRLNAGAGNFYDMRYYGTGGYFGLQYNGNNGLHLTTSSEVLINTTSDAGDYKLQVVGNARIGTGKLDISSNTAFSMNVQRSGTSEVAGTFNNSNAILYLGAESSAGGAIFTGSSSYAAVIGSGAAYPLQFATNNVTRATINTNGELLINTLTDNGDFKLQVNGNALISGGIKTANGSSSTAQPWHLGSVVATNVQLDTANYVEVEINGTFYRLAIVTPL
jgi:hypothetical protein